MPTLFQTKCDQCGYTSEPYPETYPALELNEATAWNLQIRTLTIPLTPFYRAKVSGPSSKLTALLQKQAMREGRILKYTRMYCRDCGESYEHRRYHISGLQLTGCLWPTVASAVIGLLTWLITPNGWVGGIAFLVGLGILAATLGIISDLAFEEKTEGQDS